MAEVSPHRADLPELDLARRDSRHPDPTQIRSGGYLGARSWSRTAVNLVMAADR